MAVSLASNQYVLVKPVINDVFATIAAALATIAAALATIAASAAATSA